MSYSETEWVLSDEGHLVTQFNGVGFLLEKQENDEFKLYYGAVPDKMPPSIWVVSDFSHFILTQVCDDDLLLKCSEGYLAAMEKKDV